MEAVVARQARVDEVPALAALRWESVAAERTPLDSRQDFIDEFVRWASTHEETHVPFIATRGDDPLGMAWLALGERVPAPDEALRATGDLQTMYVAEAHRGSGVGAALVGAVIRHARSRRLMLLAVLSSNRATTLYERAGFEASPQLLKITWPKESSAQSPESS